MSEVDFRKTLWMLAAMTWMLYAASSTGTLSIDPSTRFDVAESVVRYGDVDVRYESLLTLERDGGQYSVFFPGQSVVFLPVAAAGIGAMKVFGLEYFTASMAARFVACAFLLTAFTVFSLLGHIAVLRQLGVRPRIALTSGAVLAFGTTIWVWGTTGSEEAVLAAIGIWTLWALLSARDIAQAADADDPRAARHFVNRLGLAGLYLACGLTFRSTFLAVVAGAGVVALPLLVRHRRMLIMAWPRFALWTLAGLIVVSIVPFYNWLRFGDFFDAGYRRFYADIGGIFQTPLLTGLRGHLISPGKGIFLYVPWLVLLPIALLSAATWRRLGVVGVGIIVTIVLHLVVYSTHTFWSGAFGWGVRFHVSLLPLVLIPIAVWLHHVRMTSLRRTAFIALAVLSIVVQAAGLSMNTGLEHFQHPESYTGPEPYPLTIPDEAAWTWEASPLRLRFVNIARKLRGEPLFAPDVDPERYKLIASWDLFPMRAAAGQERPSVTRGLWAIWSVVLLLGVVCGVRAIAYGVRGRFGPRTERGRDE